MRHILFAVLVVALALAVYVARYVLLAAFLGAVLANTIHRAAVATAERTKLSPNWFAAGYMVAGLGAIAVVFSFGIPSVMAESGEFTSGIDQAAGDIQQWLNQREWGRRILSDESQQDFGKRIFSGASTAVTSFFESLGPILVLCVVALYATLDPRLYVHGPMWLVPGHSEGRAKSLLDRISVALLWWTAGRAASMTIVGVLSWLGLQALGVPAPLLLGFVAGLLSFVPNLGPLVAVVPAALMAFTIDGWHVLWVIVLYAGIQAVESNLITPLIQKRAVSIPPALLVVFQLSMGALAGVWGMIVATPLLVVIMLIVQTLYVRDHLGKDGPLLTDGH